MTSAASRRDHFRALHQSGTFVLPNPFDVGSARLLTSQGFLALATTSAGFAATLGRLDMAISRDELVAHTRLLAGATDLPLNVDAERCYADELDGVRQTVDLLAEAGAAGLSIEDWNPATDSIDPIDTATARVAAAADAARSHGLVLTARCENYLHGVADLDDTLARLIAYRDAGAEVLYAPLLPDLSAIRRVVQETETAINVLFVPGGPTVAELAEARVRRVSTGSLLARIAFGSMIAASQSLLDHGQLPAGAAFLSSAAAAQAFVPRSRPLVNP